MKLHRFNKIIILISVLVCVSSFAGCGFNDDVQFYTGLRLMENTSPESIDVNINNNDIKNKKGERIKININANSGGQLKFRTPDYDEDLAILVPDTEGKYPYDEGYEDKDAQKEFVNDFVKIEIYKYMVIVTFMDNPDLQSDQTFNFRVAAQNRIHTDVYISRTKRTIKTADSLQ